MQPIVEWLEGLGLGQYGEAFVGSAIDHTVLPDLTEADLEKLGVVLGHRKKLLRAIAELPAPGAALGIERPQPAAVDAGTAERRHVTVMFCDLVGSTLLSSRLDPEDLREVIGRYHAMVATTVARFDGFVAKYMGDGVLAYFGYPHAHEDDAEQAARAGLALLAVAGELQAPQRMQLRIGLATGLVVVGDLIGVGSAQEQAIVGETPNLAARLQALAEPDAMVIADNTRRQIGARFEVLDLGLQALKGFVEPQRAWRVLSENRGLGRFEALRSGATPLVGRDEEMELLLRRWAQAKAGSGRAVLMSAEAGGGKSRIAEELTKRISAEPHVRLRYFCSPHHQDSAFYPVIAQMERAAGFSLDDSSETKLAKLRELLAPADSPPEDIALTAELHALPATDLAPALDMTPQKKKEKTFEALLRHLDGLSRQQPVLMVFEDIHWIDPSSRELLDRTIERMAVFPVLLLATFRPEFQPPWTGQPRVTVLTLSRLDRRDTAAMIANIAGNSALPTDIVQEIAERTDGVPLFVEELTKAVLESGAQGAAALSAAPYPALSVPATLHASLMARLDRLGPAAKSVAQIGAAIGREFGHELLASIADRSQPELREALDQLTGSGLVLARGTPPQCLYTFKHALVQDAAYGTLLRARRQNLHARIGEVLATQFPQMSDARPELVAHHFTEAGLIECATAYWMRAGRQMLARSGMAEATALLRRGLTLMSKLPDSVWRREQELDLQITIGQAVMATEGFAVPAVGEAYARAHQLCDELNSPHKLLPILHGEWLHYHVRADLKRAKQLAAAMRQLGESQDDVVARLTACRTSGVTCFYLGDFAAARGYLENGLALFEPAQRPALAELASVDGLVDLLEFLSVVLFCCGFLEQGRSQQGIALGEARRHSHAHNLAFTLHFAWVAGWLARSDPAALLQYADELFALSDKRGFAGWRASAMAFQGWCQAALGHPSQGILLLSASIAEYRAMDATLGMPHLFTLLADACRMAGQPQVALEHLAEAEHFENATQTRWVAAESLRLRGALLLSLGECSAAEANFSDAIALAERQGAKLFKLRAATNLGQVWRDQGKRADTRDLLAPVYAWFTEGFDAPDLIEAKALLDKLEIREPNGSSALALTRDRD